MGYLVIQHCVHPELVLRWVISSKIADITTCVPAIDGEACDGAMTTWGLLAQVYVPHLLIHSRHSMALLLVHASNA